MFIVGWGRMGSAIGLQVRDAGWKLSGVWTRSQASAARARRAGLRASCGLSPPKISADLVLLTVADSAVADTAARLAPALRPPTVVIHLAGSLGLETLDALKRTGLAVGSLHPFCSVVGPDSSLRGSRCAIEGDAPARKAIAALAGALGLIPLSHPPRDRARYHLAAMLLASSAATIASEAERLLVASGLSPLEAASALSALLRSVANNLGRHGALGSLTGPIARGDPTVVRRHLALLADDPATLELYKTLGRLSLRVARAGKQGDATGQAKISALLRP